MADKRDEHIVEETATVVAPDDTVLEDPEEIVRDQLVAEADAMARDLERRRKERRRQDAGTSETGENRRAEDRRDEKAPPERKRDGRGTDSSIRKERDKSRRRQEPTERVVRADKSRAPDGESRRDREGSRSEDVRSDRSTRPERSERRSAAGERSERSSADRARSERPSGDLSSRNERPSGDRSGRHERPSRETRPPDGAVHSGAYARPPPPPPERRSRGTDPGLREPPLIPIDPPLSTVDEMAVELEDVLRKVRLGWDDIHKANRHAVIAAMGMAMGVFIPWVSFPGRPLQPGISVGGVLHLALAVTSVALVVNRHRRRREFSRSERKRRDRKISLYHILMGAASTMFGAYFFLLWGAQKTFDNPVEFHWGLYWTLFCGFGLSYGGFVRFRDPASKYP